MRHSDVAPQQLRYVIYLILKTKILKCVHEGTMLAHVSALQFGEFFNILAHLVEVCECWVVRSHMTFKCSLFFEVWCLWRKFSKLLIAIYSLTFLPLI